ncbi:MAG: bacillithiol system redox-active protein YtxJ [Saprospiraceae bacterium]|nr:bacillithiol system redox-active protein YtxJ [Saprospiraceae bacterium]
MWVKLETSDQLDDLNKLSDQKDVIIFKHSTTCSISHSAKLRLESGWDFDNLQPYLLDLKTFRSLSDTISEIYGVTHESPQVLLIRNGTCIYDASHFDISPGELRETLVYHEVR